jgi:methyl coenzyme M reductase alpha subunit
MNKVGDFSRQFGLGTIAERMGVEFTAHKAKDDAFATMKVAEAMCKEENCSLEELIKRYEITLGRIENFEITSAFSKRSKEYALEQAKRKEEKEKRRAQFHKYVEKARKYRKKDGILKGKMISFSRGIELDERIFSIIDKLFAEAGCFCYRVEASDVYVKSEDERGGRIEKAVKKNIPILTLDELEKILH